MAACYSADEDGTVQLPYDPATGELRPEVWERWLAWDPVRMAPGRADALRSLQAIYIDCGTRDEFFLDLGAEAFRRALEAIGVTDVFFELFDATHSAIEYRYPLAVSTWRTACRDRRRPPRRSSASTRGTGRRRRSGRQLEPIGPGSHTLKIKDGGGACVTGQRPSVNLRIALRLRTLLQTAGSGW